LKAWLRSDRQAELASFITEEVIILYQFNPKLSQDLTLQERTIHQKIMEGHHKSALNWYRMLVSNLNEEDEREACLSGKLSLPVLILNPAPGSSLGPNIEEAMRAVAENLTFHEVHTHGHWLQLEARNEVNAALKKFIQACDVALSKS
jgi:pimeloyl-ACP methyl ester carboxylesterase